jgi:hypothetical protein
MFQSEVMLFIHSGVNQDLSGSFKDMLTCGTLCKLSSLAKHIELPDFCLYLTLSWEVGHTFVSRTAVLSFLVHASLTVHMFGST